MAFHFIVRFEAKPGKEGEFREALRQVLEPTRAEAGCRAIRAFESVNGPLVFSIHSEWVDEAAFDKHARLPHTLRFLQTADECLTHPVQGLRLKEIGPRMAADNRASPPVSDPGQGPGT